MGGFFTFGAERAGGLDFFFGTESQAVVGGHDLGAGGAINGTLFRPWVKQYLAPTLTPGDVVVMDHFSSHKLRGVREAIEVASAKTALRAATLTQSEPDRTGILEAKETAPRQSQTNRRQTTVSLRPVLGEFMKRECRSDFDHCGIRSSRVADQIFFGIRMA